MSPTASSTGNRLPRLAMVLLLVVVASCAEERPQGPPSIRLGRDECAECGMMIADERAAAASLVRVEGHPEPHVWDDIGCLLDWEHGRSSSEILDRWVHDHETMAWVPATQATFVVSEAILTPMASGIVAFASRDRAEAARRRHGGVVVSFAELVELRDRRMAARRRPETDASEEVPPPSDEAPRPAPPREEGW